MVRVRVKVEVRGVSRFAVELCNGTISISSGLA